MEGLLSRLPPVHCISKIDLKDAFWQICLDQESCAKTAFTILNRPLYQFKRMPFGLTNAPQTMCRLMDLVIPYQLKSHVLVYLDDLLVMSNSFGDHLLHLSEVATQLRKAGLTIYVQKSQFCLKRVITWDIWLEKEQFKWIQTRSALSVNSRYQSHDWLVLALHVELFVSHIQLNRVATRQRLSMEWTCSRGLWEHQNQLIFCPMSRLPRLWFILQCDASLRGVGAVQSGCERPIAFMSKKLIKAQRNCTVTELEWL